LINNLLQNVTLCKVISAVQFEEISNEMKYIAHDFAPASSKSSSVKQSKVIQRRWINFKFEYESVLKNSDMMDIIAVFDQIEIFVNNAFIQENILYVYLRKGMFLFCFKYYFMLLNMCFFLLEYSCEQQTSNNVVTKFNILNNNSLRNVTSCEINHVLFEEISDEMKYTSKSGSSVKQSKLIQRRWINFKFEYESVLKNSDMIDIIAIFDRIEIYVNYAIIEGNILYVYLRKGMFLFGFKYYFMLLNMCFFY